jgi:hypothetical protein
MHDTRALPSAFPLMVKKWFSLVKLMEDNSIQKL